MSVVSSFARLTAGLVLAIAVSACSLPRSGPYYEELTNTVAPADFNFHVMPLTPDLARITRIDERSGFSVNFIDQPVEAVYTISRGDVLSITVWENIDEGLLNPAGIGATQLPNVRVDERGQIFVPYVGAMKAAGLTIGQLRRNIEASLCLLYTSPSPRDRG